MSSLHIKGETSSNASILQDEFIAERSRWREEKMAVQSANIVDNGRAQLHMHKTWQNWREENRVFFNNLLHVAISS